MLKRTMLSLFIASITGAATTTLAEKPKDISLTPIGTYITGAFDESAAEIVSYDPATQRLFVINANDKTVDLLDITDPTNPVLSGVIDVAIEIPASGGVNSVAVHDGLVAVAVENDDKQSDGWVAFYDTNGSYLNHVQAGALPDMVTFTPNGNYALSANEGEPSDDYTIDPKGTISIIDLRQGVQSASVATADFTQYNSAAPAGVRITGPGASVAQDLEPEYITVSHDSSTAWVTLQENNAIATVDIKSASITDLTALGTKDHMLPGNGLDASNRDDAINITNWPVQGLYMPDSIASFRSKGKTYLITANEGDAREYIFDTDEDNCPTGPQYEYDDGECIYLDSARIKDLDLDAAAFSGWDIDDLQEDENLGRLNVITTAGDTDNDGDFDVLYSYGARSISIWDDNVSLVFDSGDMLEQATAIASPENFNSTNDENDSFDNRSDDKGPEPEGVTTGKIRGETYAFVGLERVGGIAIFEVTEPAQSRLVSYLNFRDFSVDDVEDEYAGDLGPEGLLFISADDSPNGEPLLVVGNEISGTTTIYRINTK